LNDLTDKITSMLNDPESMETIRNIAASFMGENDDAPKPEPRQSEKSGGGFDPSSLMSGMTPDQLSGMMKIMSALNSNKDDDRTALLMALRPHLSAKRQMRLDRAVKLLKIAKIMPAVTESGLFKL
jgi:hypothetical protein